jgi:hypothetical protein
MRSGCDHSKVLRIVTAAASRVTGGVKGLGRETIATEYSLLP